MAVEHALAQKSKERAKQTAQVTNINEYVSVNAAEPGNSSGRMPQLRFTFITSLVLPLFRIRLD